MARSAGVVLSKRLIFLNKSRDAELRSMQQAVDRSVGQDVVKVNSLATEIADLTLRITAQEAISPAHELRDQRESLVTQLSKIVEVKELESGGTYQLTIGGYHPLVLDGSARSIGVARSAATGFLEIRAGTDDITADISGGRLGSSLALRDTYIPKYLNDLDQLAYEIAGQVNSLHSAAYDLNGNTGADFFEPLASVSGAARDLKLSSAVTSSLQNIAASRQATGLDNEAAISMGNLLHAAVFSGGTVIDQYGSFVFSVGSDAANAELQAQQHEASVNQLENRRQEVSGVSIDEESISILQFQRAYEASARVVKVVDELLQVTLSLGA